MTSLTQQAFIGGATLVPNNFQFNVPYATLGTMTSGVAAPMFVMNPADGPFKTAMQAFNDGYLNPNQKNWPANYYSISTAYGKEPTTPVGKRACGGTSIVPATSI